MVVGRSSHCTTRPASNGSSSAVHQAVRWEAGWPGHRGSTAGTKAHLAGTDYSYACRASDGCQRHPADRQLQRGRLGYTGAKSENEKRDAKDHGEVPEMQICATCVRIPVANCHSETITVETERPVSPAEVAAELNAPLFSGIVVADDWPGRGVIRCPPTAPAVTKSSWGAFGEICRTPTASTSGASATTCEKVPRQTLCKLPSCWLHTLACRS